MTERKSGVYLSIMVTDFLVWSATTGLYPLLSRLADAELGDSEAPNVIARLVLVYTLSAMVGRAIMGRSLRRPREIARMATVLVMFSYAGLFHSQPVWWMLARSVQGFAMGCYAISVMMLMSLVIPPHRRMRGFALVGMADFLGFSFGPVLSGLSVAKLGFSATLWLFVGLMVCAVISASKLPSHELNAEINREEGKQYPWRFLPLAMALCVGFLFHIYYGNYLPISVATHSFPVETLFFAGYMVGGIGYRLGFVGLMERLRGYHSFALTLLLMGLTSISVSLWPENHVLLDPIVFVTGLIYGLGLEALYIFSLSWVSQHADLKERAKAFVVVFSGIDVAAVFAGLSYGAAVSAWGIPGLLRTLLISNLLLLILPFMLARTFKES